MLAEVLLSIAYAADVGDPDGTVLLADDVSRRHDFGFGAKDVESCVCGRRGRCRAQDVTPGVPWHVSGSLLGLDVALAPLALRRLNFERVLEAPKLTSNERDTFALSVSLLNPVRPARRRSRRDRRRDRARQRAARRANWRRRRRTRRRRLRRDRRRTRDGGVAAPRACAGCSCTSADRVPSMFSLTEMLVLGGGRPADLDAWGMSMVVGHGLRLFRA